MFDSMSDISGGITLFGATGGTGRQILQQACEAGHEVTAVVRDPARLDWTHPRLTVLRADVMDPTAIAPAIRGSAAVVSALGSRAGRVPTTVCADSATSIITAMRAEGVRRLVVLSAGVVTTDGDGPFSRFLLKPILGKVLEHTAADKRRMEEIVRASGLEWTIVRPARLTDQPASGTYRTAIDRNVRGGLRTSRADLADYVLRSLTDPAAPTGAAISIAS
ncbi:NADH-flavin reductase [Amycolatopsis taiwanensis]|uniref:NADH-flavin reductase n=2 Tax=Amycolatopsis taiwanensis TaxID=342230 RepID=A0A9W6QWK9_9PSEU|nr:NADH-flavin reductase [Amycolatopsis taiwanensis]